MKKDSHKPMNIELRSDEVQELMGRVPPYIQRVGISVILLIVIGFFIASAFIKYPTYIPVKARMLPNEYFETILCPQNGTIIWAKKYTVSLVHPDDTLCLLLTAENDTLAIKSPCLGKASCTDILEQGMAVDVNRAQPTNPVGGGLSTLTQNRCQTIHDCKKSSTFAS